MNEIITWDHHTVNQLTNMLEDLYEDYWTPDANDYVVILRELIECRTEIFALQNEIRHHGYHNE